MGFRQPPARRGQISAVVLTALVTFVVAWLLPPAAVPAQQIVVRVVDQVSGLPLMNAEVIYRGSGRSLLTNQRGEVPLPVDAGDAYPLRIRQLGYRFVDTTVSAGVVSPLTISLQRVAYVLPVVAAIENDACQPHENAATSLLTATALEQLKMGAERYNTFRKEYPFRITQERLTETFTESGKTLTSRRRMEKEDSERWGDRYEPGGVVIYSGLGFSVPILFIANLADPVFWKHHCFAARPFIWLGSSVVRIDFSPAPTVKTPDWAGWAILDSATSALRRVEFRLVGLTENSSPRKFEGFTTFSSPSAYVVVPESSAAMWWRRARSSPASWPDVLQVLHLKGLSYRKKTPGN